MTPNQIIYLVHNSPTLLKLWRELSGTQKRAVVKECETAQEIDVEKIIKEVVNGQRRLFNF